jgi:transcriptional regulator with XRE-family HTH domain
LRAARDHIGLTQEQVADRLEWSSSKVIRIEAGAVGISTTDLRALLRLYGVHDPARVTELAELAKLSRKRSWWSAIKDDQISAQQRMLIGYEVDTTSQFQFHPLVIPGLLQTEGYAIAILLDCAYPPPTPSSVETRVEVKLHRQRDTLFRPDPPSLHVLLEEDTVRRIVGDREVMREQIEHLLNLAARPHITLQILPRSAGAHPGLVYGGFTILRFEDSADPDVVYVDGGPGDMILSDEPEKIGMYWEIFARLRDLALTPARSAETLEEIRLGLIA